MDHEAWQYFPSSVCTTKLGNKRVSSVRNSKLCNTVFLLYVPPILPILSCFCVHIEAWQYCLSCVCTTKLGNNCFSSVRIRKLRNIVFLLYVPLILAILSIFCKYHHGWRCCLSSVCLTKLITIVFSLIVQPSWQYCLSYLCTTKLGNIVFLLYVPPS